MSTLNLDAKVLNSLTLIESPINVAMEQCGTVGVNRTLNHIIGTLIFAQGIDVY